MTDDLVPADVRQFIIENLDSIAQLEGLLLLSSDPDTAYTTAELASRLYTDQKQAGEVLASLHSTGFTVFADKDNTSYRYEPRLPELAEMVTPPGCNLFAISDPGNKFDPFKAPDESSKVRGRVQDKKGGGQMMVGLIDTLCALTAFLCAWMLFRAYQKSEYKLLLWGGICFIGLTLNNLLLIVDKFIVLYVDLSSWRLALALLSLLVFLYGLILDSE